MNSWAKDRRDRRLTEKHAAWKASQERFEHPHTPRIFAVDDPESTFYVLVVRGEIVASAHWPHPLLEMEPAALSGGTLGEGCCLGPSDDLVAALDPWLRVHEPGFTGALGRELEAIPLQA